MKIFFPISLQYILLKQLRLLSLNLVSIYIFYLWFVHNVSNEHFFFFQVTTSSRLKVGRELVERSRAFHTLALDWMRLRELDSGIQNRDIKNRDTVAVDEANAFVVSQNPKRSGRASTVYKVSGRFTARSGSQQHPDTPNPVPRAPKPRVLIGARDAHGRIVSFIA